MTINVVVRRTKDYIKIGDAINKVVTKYMKKKKGLIEIGVRTSAHTIARSWRARVAQAPYNSRSSRPGPHSRSGGVPLERSIKVHKLNKYRYVLTIVDVGGTAPADSKPSAYANYKKQSGTPLRYKVEAIKVGINRLKQILKS